MLRHDPAIFDLDELDLDALFAELAMQSETIEFIDFGIKAIRAQIPDGEVQHLVDRRELECDRRDLTRELIRRKRAYDRGDSTDARE